MASKDAFQKGTVKKTEICVTPDIKTSDICCQMDGKNFFYDDFRPEVTVLPFHAYCRSMIVPCFDDEIERDIDEEMGRIARDPVTKKVNR